MRKKVIVTKHVLIPKHVKLSQKDKEDLLKKYNITIKELPKIFKDDTAIASLNVKPGDVVKIIRPSKTAGESVFYRNVTNV